MRILKYVGVILIILMAFCAAAMAAGSNVDFQPGATVKNNTNTSPLTTASPVHWISGSFTAPNPTKANFIHSGTLLQSFNVGAGTGQNGTFSVANTTVVGACYLRIWQTTPAQGAYYTRVSVPGSAADDPMPTQHILGNIYCNYKAEVPYKPIITKMESTTTTDFVANTKTVALTLFSGQPSPTDGIREIVSYQWEVTPVPIGTVVMTGSSIKFEPENLLTGQEYTVRVRHVNYFGGTWSDPVKFEAGAELEPGVAVENEADYTFTNTAGFGMNTFAMPFAGLTAATKQDGTTTVDVSTVAKMIAEINAQTGGKNVEAFGWYDSVNQTYYGLTGITYKGDGTIDASEPVGLLLEAGKTQILATEIRKGQPYQVSVSKTGAFYLKGN